LKLEKVAFSILSALMMPLYALMIIACIILGLSMELWCCINRKVDQLDRILR